MSRWFLTAVLGTSSLTAVGVAQDASNVMTIRTAGQPERKVQVLRTSPGEGGQSITEVKDLATGEVYSLMMGLPASTPQAALAPAAVPNRPILNRLVGNPATPTAPATAARPEFLPRAKDRAGSDPLMAGTSIAAAAGVPMRGTEYENASKFPTANRTPEAQRPGMLARLVGSPAVPVATAKSAAPKFFPTPTAQRPPYVPPAATAATAPPAVTPVQSRLPAAPAAPQVVAAPPAPVAPQFAAPQIAVAAPAVIAPPASVAAPAALPPVVVPTVPVPTAAMKPAPGDSGPIHVVLPVGEVPAETAMKEELTPVVTTLQTHLRPSYRLEAASTLADSRFAGRDEVKAILAHAALYDPAPIVRGHCITCLTKLGYAEPGYLQKIAASVDDPEPAVRRAAVAAMEKR